MARQLFWLLLIVTASIAIGLWLRPGWPAPPTVHVQPRDAQSWLLQLAAAGLRSPCDRRPPRKPQMQPPYFHQVSPPLCVAHV